jgi:hypothetical protein
VAVDYGRLTRRNAEISEIPDDTTGTRNSAWGYFGRNHKNFGRIFLCAPLPQNLHEDYGRDGAWDMLPRGAPGNLTGQTASLSWPRAIKTRRNPQSPHAATRGVSFCANTPAHEKHIHHP